MSTPKSFRVLPWPLDPPESVDALGLYAETYWLPILHPTAYLLGRRLASLSVRAKVIEGNELVLDALTLATALGIANRIGEPNHPTLQVYGRSMRRLVRYRMVKWRDATAEVRTRWPRLDNGLLSALPVEMQQAEPDYWAAEDGRAALISGRTVIFFDAPPLVTDLIQ